MLPVDFSGVKHGDFISGRIFGLRRAGATWESHAFLKTGLGIASFGEDEAGNLSVVDLSGGVHRIFVATSSIYLPLIVTSSAQHAQRHL